MVTAKVFADLGILEQSFVLYPLGGYSRNLRDEMVQRENWEFLGQGVGGRCVIPRSLRCFLANPASWS
jgi:hypothetical protein